MSGYVFLYKYTDHSGECVESYKGAMPGIAELFYIVSSISTTKLTWLGCEMFEEFTLAELNNGLSGEENRIPA